MKSILYLTDFAYLARGRRYCDEDIFVTDYLRGRFHVATCHPACCEPFEDAADLVVFRNAGAVAGFQEAYDAFRSRADADLAFARRFVEWNGIARGIERVDACRTREGGLRDVHVKNLP